MWKMFAVLAACMAALLSPSRAAPPTGPQHQVFFVGGAYAESHGKRVMTGQMYVEAILPAHRTHPLPLVLIHGAAQTAVNWMTTPDGREGWAAWFADHGWAVYLVDQPARGRSAWNPDLQPPLSVFPAETIEHMFTDPQDNPAWPQAKLHTQWPGSGQIGDKVFDQFYASQVPSLANDVSEGLMRAAGAALLDRIGPAILVTHSQAGSFGWLIADARPKLVRGIVALEPIGPPYKDALFQTGHDRPFGLTVTPLTYDPPVTDAAPLAFAQDKQPATPERAACWSQASPARRLPNLQAVPVLLLTSEASYHAVYDHCTADYLKQAGVPVDFERLADHGIKGNAHMMMLEKNNLDIAAFIDGWLARHVR